MTTQTPPQPLPERHEVRLEERYTAESGPVMLGGIQALVRLMLDLRRLDRRRGHDTGVFVSGYQGSPLGGLDQELAREQPLLAPEGIVFHAGLNEELAATAVGGTQLLGQLPGATKQGVTGFWYGKNPGFDRAADAIRHSTLSGTAPLGGAVALIGDDPTSKSSTVPSACESMCRTLAMPVLAPGTISELVEYGLHAVALSRHAGLWTGLKVVADLADASGVVQAGAALDAIPQLPLRPATDPPVLLPPSNLVAEQDLFTTRLERVHEYARLTKLNRITFDPHHARIGVIASGVGYQAVLRALELLGLEQADMERLGLRLIKLGMPWPLQPDDLRALVSGLHAVLVVEDKLPFVESQLKEALYHEPGVPLVFGKRDHEGKPLLPVGGAVGADEIAQALAQLVPGLELPRVATLEPLADLSKRTPYFCSGCPHNTSTRADADQLIGVGIGCHTMVALDQPGRRGKLLGMPQMGGEGAQWFGLAPFVSEPHFSQNMGDGTFHHSGSLAIRAAIAAGVSITYRLLYNDAVAMTGGQRPEGKLSVAQIAQELELEGVRRIVVTTPEPEQYRTVTLPSIAEVRHRDEYERVQAELAAVPGVTVLIHDDRCATEKRRLRKRGKLPVPAERIWINERVCEGCGDCGEKSSCLSVLPVQTEFGRKTRIQQSSCNQDRTCLKGDCPSFVMVTPRDGVLRHEIPAPPAELPEPTLRVPQDVLVRMPGVGGTGVVTVAAILRMAAYLQGRHAAGLDQTGLAQKGGPVVSDLRISSAPIDGQIRASRGSVDVLLGFDLMGCVDAATLATLDSRRTVAVLNSDITPTAEHVTDVSTQLPLSARLVAHVRKATRAGDTIALTAETLSEGLFGDHMQANLLVVGAAYQHGCLPLSAAAIEQAIELNGAAVAANIAAFRWGRAVIADPAALENALSREVAGLRPATSLSLPELLRRNEQELTRYQDRAYARRYSDDVQALSAAVSERLKHPEQSEALIREYARGLFKLMAYKDEYEVARLHLDSIERARLRTEFGDGARVQVLLHPPLLRAMGLDHKIRLGRSAQPLFRALRAGRRLRGGPLDPFGHAHVRRVERALIDEYRGLVAAAVQRLTPENAALVLEIARLPELVRGYEQIKLAGVERMRERAAELNRALAEPGLEAPRTNGRLIELSGH